MATEHTIALAAAPASVLNLKAGIIYGVKEGHSAPFVGYMAEECNAPDTWILWGYAPDGERSVVQRGQLGSIYRSLAKFIGL